LRGAKLPHTVLNAKNHAKEAEIIAAAGQKGAITVATNMAGRGTDIKLSEGVAALGGLHVIGTTRHQSRRIDRQLRGRCARQGDPGTSCFYVSFEDHLMRLFTSPKLSAFLQRFRPPEGEAISAPVLNRSIETAQKRVEQRNFAMRKHTLEYDDVMNKQRAEVYAFRNEGLKTDEPLELASNLLEDLCLEVSPEYNDTQDYLNWVSETFPVTVEGGSTREEVETLVVEKVVSTFKKRLNSQASIIAAVQQNAKREVTPVSILNDIVRSMLIRGVDQHWQHHLLAIDNLRSDVAMRVVGQKDPLMEFKHEAFALFQNFSKELKTEIANALFSFEMMMPDSPKLKLTIEKLNALNQGTTYIT